MASDYTTQDLFLLAGTPHMIGTAMTMAGKSGFIGTGKEMFASARSVLAGVKDYPHNELIRDVTPNVEEGAGAAMGEAKKCREWMTARIKERGVDSREAMTALVLDDCRSVAALLAEKSPQAEAAEYKQWALSVAEKVAMAASEGGFLGFGGERFSEPEQKFLSEIEAALGLPGQGVI